MLFIFALALLLPPPSPAPQVPLSARGWEQAVACGHSLRTMMEAEHGPNYKLFFMTSPYCRTRQTFVGIRQAFPDENFAGVQVGRHRHSVDGECGVWRGLTQVELCLAGAWSVANVSSAGLRKVKVAAANVRLQTPVPKP